MRKLLNLMKSATEEEVSESFFSPKVSQEEFYKRLNDMVDIFKDNDKIVDVLSERLNAVTEIVKSQQGIIDVLSERIKEDSEIVKDMADKIKQISDFLDVNPPGSKKPDGDPIH